MLVPCRRGRVRWPRQAWAVRWPRQPGAVVFAHMCHPTHLGEEKGWSNHVRSNPGRFVVKYGVPGWETRGWRRAKEAPNGNDKCNRASP